MPPENHQVGSTGGTQLLVPLLTLMVFLAFSVGERRILDCQHGVQYYKPKKGLGKCNQGTRKIGCKAHIVLREYILYPDYNVANSYDSKCQVRLAKEEQLKKTEGRS